MQSYDFAIIGAGISGASAAYELQAQGRTLLLEREPLPGFHTTGRSAAFLVESYGARVAQLLTRAGREFLEHPPKNFAPHPLLTPRVVLWVARPDQCKELTDRMRRVVIAGTGLEEIDSREAETMCPVLRKDYVAMGVVERRARHIDVAALLDAYLRGFRARGGEVITHAGVTALSPMGEGWEITCGDTRYTAGVVVNAAGAWAEEIGALAGARPIGLRPLRRTAITFDPPPGSKIADWPCVIDAEEKFYLKPEGAQLLASPCDETPSPPCDVVPDDLDVALAAERVMQATTLEIRHLRRRWAGLRSFVADRGPVIGRDPDLPGFFWLAGQGGSGIMTSSSAARAAASLIVNGALPSDQKALGLTPELLAPSRPALQGA
jgi:D-arginine dehydrogenase